jgi:Ni,Fe-hydrogenase maturation factor
MGKIYVCGNVVVDNDSMPFRVLPLLKKSLPDIEFIEFDPTENFPEADPLFIIDTVLGAAEPFVINNLDTSLEQLADSPKVSAHDADLAFHLKWLGKLEKLPKVVVFGVPETGDEAKIAEMLGILIAEQTGI